MIVCGLLKNLTIADYLVKEHIDAALAKYTRQHVVSRLRILETQVTLEHRVWAPQRYPVWLRELLAD